MTETNTAIDLQAANDNPGGAQSVQVALTRLVGLMARAEAQAAARKTAANTQR